MDAHNAAVARKRARCRAEARKTVTRCQQEGCRRIAYHNLPGASRPIYCREHRYAQHPCRSRSAPHVTYVGSVQMELCAGAMAGSTCTAAFVWTMAAPRCPPRSPPTSGHAPPTAQSSAIRTRRTAWWTCPAPAVPKVPARLSPCAWHACLGLNVHATCVTSD